MLHICTRYLPFVKNVALEIVTTFPSHGSVNKHSSSSFLINPKKIKSTKVPPCPKPTVVPPVQAKHLRFYPPSFPATNSKPNNILKENSSSCALQGYLNHLPFLSLVAAKGILSFAIVSNS